MSFTGGVTESFVASMAPALASLSALLHSPQGNESESDALALALASVDGVEQTCRSFQQSAIASDAERREAAAYANAAALLLFTLEPDYTVSTLPVGEFLPSSSQAEAGRCRRSPPPAPVRRLCCGPRVVLVLGW